MNKGRWIKEALLLVYLIIFGLPGYTQSGISDKHIRTSLRMVGHQVLLNTGDSTSRVLPIIQLDGNYILQFDTEFSFNPDELVNTVNSVMKETKISNGYIMEVRVCNSGEVVYGYEIGILDSMNIVPCLSRDIEKACYNLVFTLLEPNTIMDEQLAKLEHDKIAATSDFSRSVYWSLIISMAVFMILFFLWRNRKIHRRDPDLISLGQFLFDKNNAELILKEQKIDLSSKETDLLLLLYENVNQTVQKEVILQKVWENDGEYVGRTLDVFISKLRKKLQADPTIKIINTRGVGYRLTLK